ncbi:MAG: DUF2029 domain-containing protein [Candidatus Aminicenantes bacterium]|nr:MAG: DUF2029 domain-containing protein [Candidatus Aminicenantes bacterium]
MKSSDTKPQPLGIRFSPIVRRGLIAAAVFVAVAEAVFVAKIVHERGLFEYVALDYRGSRTAGEAILEHGLGAPYQPELLEAAQRKLYDRYVRETGRGALPFGVVPVPYPPPFSLVFVPSTFLDPVPGFLVWTCVHLAVFLLYQVRLGRVFKVSGPGWLIAAVMLSPPVFIHLVMGQISVWLMVFFGEAMIAFDRGHLFRVGAWLGLLVVKPQTLVLIIPVLVVNGQWRMLFGLATAVAAAIAPTLIVAGSWVKGYVGGLLKFFGATGMVMNSFPRSMTNWRAFALNASRVLPPIVAWAGAVFGMTATGVAGFLCGLGLRRGERAVVPLAWLGLVAATNAFTWHAHVHQALMLVPPLYWVVGRWPDLKEPVAAVCLSLALVFLVSAFSTNVGFAHDLLGMAFLAVLVATALGCAMVIRAVGSSSSEMQ